MTYVTEGSWLHVMRACPIYCKLWHCIWWVHGICYISFRNVYKKGMAHISWAPNLHALRVWKMHSPEQHDIRVWYMPHKLQNCIQWGHDICFNRSKTAWNESISHVLKAQQIHMTRTWHMLHELQNCMWWEFRPNLISPETECNEGIAYATIALEPYAMLALQMLHILGNCI